MSKPDDILELVNAYATRTETPRIPFEAFVRFCRKVAERKGSQEERFVDLAGAQVEPILISHLRALSQRGPVTISFSDGMPTEIYYSEYYLSRVAKAYDRIDAQPSRPFPNEDNIDFALPSEVVYPVVVSEEFTKWIDADTEGPERLLRLQFPDALPSVLVPSGMIPERLLPICIQKIRLHLRNERNAGYMHHKLLNYFPTREIALRESLNQLLTTPRDSVAAVQKPSDFTYNFWNQVCNTLIKEARAGEHESHDSEFGLPQAAHLIGYYNTYYRGADQKRRETEHAEKTLQRALDQRTEPFTFAEIAELPDERGNPLSKRLSTERIAAIIESRMSTDSETDLPDILLVRGADERDYYVMRTHALAYVLGTRSRLADELKRFYSQAWYRALRTDRLSPVMKSDEEFDRHIRSELRRRAPVFAGMLQYELLTVLSRQAPPDGAFRADLQLMLDPSAEKIRPMPEVFELDRKRLMKDAELMLPFYLATPAFRAIARLIRRIFGVSRYAGGEEVSSGRPIRHASAGGRTGYSDSDDEFDEDPATAHGVVGPAGEQADSSDVHASSLIAKRRERRKSKGSVGQKPVSAEYQEKVKAIARDFVPDGKNIDQAMRELVDQWNPLLDTTAKKNLVEDVNSLVRDFLRRMRAGFRVAPPGPDRIRHMAGELSEKDAFSKIRRKEALRRYIELYMLKLLGRL